MEIVVCKDLAEELERHFGKIREELSLYKVCSAYIGKPTRRAGPPKEHVFSRKGKAVELEPYAPQECPCWQSSLSSSEAFLGDVQIRRAEIQTLVSMTTIINPACAQSLPFPPASRRQLP